MCVLLMGETSHDKPLTVSRALPLSINSHKPWDPDLILDLLILGSHWMRETARLGLKLLHTSCGCGGFQLRKLMAAEHAQAVIVSANKPLLNLCTLPFFILRHLPTVGLQVCPLPQVFG